MKDSMLRLQDKSVLIFGDFNNLSQSLIRDFTVLGADVGFLNSTQPAVSRFLENVNDARNVHPEYGRAAQIEVAISDKSSAFEATSRMAELFGRIDVVVDAKMPSLALDREKMQASRFLIEEITPFFQNKKRGRIVFIREDESLTPLLPTELKSFLTEEFFPWTQTISAQWRAPAYGVNSVAVGLTEDLILRKFPQGKSIRASFESLKQENPNWQLVDSNEITSAVMFLASSTASGVSGQILRVNRGSAIALPA